MGRTHTGAVHAELQPMGRTQVGEVCGELSPMRGTSQWSRGRVRGPPPAGDICASPADVCAMFVVSQIVQPIEIVMQLRSITL